MRLFIAIPVGVVSLLSFQLPAADLVVPVVLDVRSGAAHYRTELTLTNGGAAPAVLDFTYRGSLGTAFGSALEELGAGTQRTIPDVIAWLVARGVSFPDLASGAPQAGTLRITLPDEQAASIAAVARTTTPTGAPHPVGAAGLAYLAADPASAFAGRAVVHGLRATETERSNLAVWNPGSSTVTVRIVAASGTGDGREVPVAESWNLEPGDWRQVDGILAKAGIPQGWAFVERVEGGSFSAYGVVNDGGTNDGSFLEAAPDAAAPEAIVVPVLVETPGFRTELILANRGPAAAPLDLDFRESLSPSAGEGGHATVTLAPREQRIVADAFAWLRSLGIVAGPAGSAPRAGRLRVTGPPGATGLWAAARSPPLPAAGPTASSCPAPGPPRPPEPKPGSPASGRTGRSGRTSPSSTPAPPARARSSSRSAPSTGSPAGRSRVLPRDSLSRRESGASSPTRSVRSGWLPDGSGSRGSRGRLRGFRTASSTTAPDPASGRGTVRTSRPSRARPRRPAGSRPPISPTSAPSASRPEESAPSRSNTGGTR